MTKSYKDCGGMRTLPFTKFALLVVFCLFLSLNGFAEGIVSIYDIQFTTNPGFDGTYPSPLINQTVTIQGVVTATGFENNRIFVSAPSGGAWSAIAIESVRNRVSVGDFIQVQGKVSEIMGMTVITQPQNIKILHRNMPIPAPLNVSAHDVVTIEAYESVLVRISNLTCKRLLNGAFLATIEDDTAGINVGNGFDNELTRDFFVAGANYSYMIGIVNFAYNRFAIHPRSMDDVGGIQTGIRSSSWGQIKSLYR